MTGVFKEQKGASVAERVKGRVIGNEDQQVAGPRAHRLTKSFTGLWLSPF